MESGLDLALLQVRNEPLTLSQVRHEQIEHVIGLLGMSGDDWEPHVLLLRPVPEVGPVEIPDPLPCGLDVVPSLELAEEHRRQKIGRQVAGSDVDPRVLVDLPSEEAAAI